VEEELGDKVDMVLDGGACEVGLESTIVDLSGDQPRLLRQGQISKTEIEQVLQMSVEIPEKDAQIHAPGRMEVHYAPITRTVLCTTLQLQTIFQYQKFHDKKIGVVNYSLALDESPQVHVITMPRQADEYAHALYSTLRELDHLSLDIILIEQPPQKEAWRAINDRLGKAAKSCPDDKESNITDKHILEGLLLLLFN
jgi:L-threonylcarbamoyladenylate synthase